MDRLASRPGPQILPLGRFGFAGNPQLDLPLLPDSYAVAPRRLLRTSGQLPSDRFHPADMTRLAQPPTEAGAGVERGSFLLQVATVCRLRPLGRIQPPRAPCLPSFKPAWFQQRGWRRGARRGA